MEQTKITTSSKTALNRLMGDASLAEIIQHPAWAYIHPELELLEVHVSKDPEWLMTDMLITEAITRPYQFCSRNAKEVIDDSAGLQYTFHRLLEHRWRSDCNLFSDDRIKQQADAIFGEHQTKKTELITTTSKVKLWVDCASEFVAELCGNIGDFDEDCFEYTLEDFKDTLQTVCAQYVLVWNAYLAPINGER